MSESAVSWHLQGELAQLVECCDRTAEARGSSLLFSIHTLVVVNMSSIYTTSQE